MRYTLRTPGMRDLEVDSASGPLLESHALLPVARRLVADGSFDRTPTGPIESVGWDTPAALAEALSGWYPEGVTAFVDDEPVEMAPIAPIREGVVY
jgi:hypothetical protein